MHFFDIDKTLIIKNSYEIVLNVLRRRIISCYRFFYYKFFFAKNIDKKMKSLASVSEGVEVSRLDKIMKAFFLSLIVLKMLKL